MTARKRLSCGSMALSACWYTQPVSVSTVKASAVPCRVRMLSSLSSTGVT